MKVLLKGYYGFGNFGDDILMKVTWGILNDKLNNPVISIHSNFTSNLKNFEGPENYNEYIFDILDDRPELVDWTKSQTYDILVDGGGGIYFDYSEGNYIHKILNLFYIRLGSDVIFKVDQWLRRLADRKNRIVFKNRIALGIGIGPYNIGSGLLYQHLVEIGSTNVFFVRDAVSWQLLNQFKFEGQKYLCSDLAFIDSYWLPAGVKPKQRVFRGNVGIILLDWHVGSQNRFNEFKRFAESLTGAGYSVTFFSFAENNDKQYIREFQNQYNMVVWRPAEIVLKDFLKRLSDQDIVFSARAHGSIVSSILGIPTICIGTSNKMVEVSKILSESSMLIEEPVTLSDLEYKLRLAVKNYDSLLLAVQRDVEKNRKLIQDSLVTLNSFL